MAFKIRAYNVDDGNEVVNNIEGLAFYKEKLIEAGNKYNRASAEKYRIGYWNLDGPNDKKGKIWSRKENETKNTRMFRTLLDNASYEMYNFYYQFVDLNAPNIPLKDENNNDIFQNLVRFTLNDFYYALDYNKDNQIIEYGNNSFKLEQHLPYLYSLAENNLFLYPNPNPILSFFVDIDHPEAYFVMESGKWLKKDLTEAELKDTEILYWIDNVGNIHCGKIKVPERRSRSAGGGGGGAMRADSITEVEYKWSGKKALGIALGLHKDLFIDNDTPPAGYFDATPLVSGTNRPKSLIWYFKKFKNLAQANDKRNEPKPPKVPIPPKVFEFTTRNQLGKSKYFYSTDFFKLRQKGKKEEPTGWLGLGLQHSNTRDRDDAGPVMGQALNDFENFKQSYENWRMQKNPQPPKSSSTVSADHFTDFMLSKPVYEAQWKQLKQEIYTAYGKVPDVTDEFEDWDKRRTNQEWCHLFGHGDGGLEQWGNFVAGSKHCNTVQLAIETGQRKGKIPGLKVKVSAYLFEHFELKEPATFQDLENYFKDNLSEIKYKEVIKLWEEDTNNMDTGSELGERLPDDFGETLIKSNTTLTKQETIDLLNHFCVAYPLAKMIHYKVYKGNENVFEYFFDAQSESFNYNEFKILEDMVVRSIARMDKKMQEAYNEVMFKKLSDQVNKGNITLADFEDIKDANYFPLISEEEGDIDSSEDEEDNSVFSPKIIKKRSSFSGTKSDSLSSSASSLKKSKTVKQDTDYSFILTPPPQ